MRFLLSFIASASLLSGCAPTHAVERSAREEGMYAFARPQEFVIFGTKSARDWLEIVSSRQEPLPDGRLCVTLALRNRGTQHWYDWHKKSRDMTLYAQIDFYDSADGGHVVQSAPKRAIPLPLGETVHLRWQAASTKATFARVTFTE